MIRLFVTTEPKLFSSILSFSALRATLLLALGVSTVSCGDGGGGGAGAGGGGGEGGNTTIGGGGATGGTAGGTTNGSGGATNGSAGTIQACANPEPVFQSDDTDSGIVRCEDGALNRLSAASCGIPSDEACFGGSGSCTKHSDCTEFPNGSCQAYPSMLPFETGGTCGCTYGCTTDADCTDGYACLCPGISSFYAGSRCVLAECKTNADCPSGECGFMEFNNGCNTDVMFACRDAEKDECHSSATCSGQQCAKITNGSPWMCSGPTCTIGRPLLVENTLRFAPPTRRLDWSFSRTRTPNIDRTFAAQAVENHSLPNTDDLPETVRLALAAHYEQMAAMEHASVASFARFALELLALGAPPDLLLATHKAAADEILHAQLCYTVASVYSSHPIGPGLLPMAGVHPQTDPAEIVTALVIEACVGETIAAAEAVALAGIVKDPALHTLYQQIAIDESTHAELGYRCLAWILVQHPHLVPVAAAAFDRALASISGTPLTETHIVATDHGLLSERSLLQLRKTAAAEIVRPCRAALFAELRTSRETTLTTSDRAALA